MFFLILQVAIVFFCVKLNIIISALIFGQIYLLQNILVKLIQ